jgi:hypothetical protein
MARSVMDMRHCIMAGCQFTRLNHDYRLPTAKLAKSRQNLDRGSYVIDFYHCRDPRRSLSLPVCQVTQPAAAGQRRNRVTPPTCIALAVLFSVRKLLADRQMGQAKKSHCHPATSR